MTNFARIVVIVTSMFMLVGGMILNLIGLISPSWQVVDIREFQAEHHVSFLGISCELFEMLSLWLGSTELWL
jgi:hypothetical protein